MSRQYHGIFRWNVLSSLFNSRTDVSFGQLKIMILFYIMNISVQLIKVRLRKKNPSSINLDLRLLLDIVQTNKAHKANDASSCWWNYMNTWLIFTYLLKNNDFPCFWQKCDGRTDRPTDRPTDRRTDPVIEMRGRIRKAEYKKNSFKNQLTRGIGSRGCKFCFHDESLW